MKLLSALMLLMVGCGTTPPVQAAPRVPIEAAEYSAIASSHVDIFGPSGSGSGTVISIGKEGTGILSAAHVCMGPPPPGAIPVMPTMTSLILIDHTGTKGTGRVTRLDMAKDLCLVMTRSKLNSSPATIATKEPHMGARVRNVMGAFFSTTAYTLGEHRYSGSGNDSENRASWSVYTPAFFPGDSGGAVYFEGKVVGVVSMILFNPRLRLPQIGYAARLSEIRRFLSPTTESPR